MGISASIKQLLESQILKGLSVLGAGVIFMSSLTVDVNAQEIYDNEQLIEATEGEVEYFESAADKTEYKADYNVQDEIGIITEELNNPAETDKDDYEPDTDKDDLLFVDTVESLRGSTERSNPARIDTNTRISDSVDDNRYRYYYFELNKPGRVYFTFGHEVLGTPSDVWEIELYSPDGYSSSSEILSEWFQGSTTGDKEAGLVGLPAGKYYFEVYANSEGINKEYHFTVNYSQSDVWEKEIDSRTHPTSIPVNTQIHGSVQNADRNDYYYFEINKPGRISFTFGHDVLGTPSDIWELELFSPNGFSSSYEILNEWFQGSETRDLEVGIAGLPAGKYYIQIYGNADGIGAEYHFTVNYTESEYWEREIDASNNPTYIPLDKTIYGNVQNGQRNDYYWFEILEPSSVSIVFGHEVLSIAKDIWEVELFNSNGYSSFNEMGTWWFMGNENKLMKTGAIRLEPGKYYLQIYGNSEGIDAPYNFMVSTPPVLPTSIKLDPSEMRLEVGTTGQISYVISPETATDKTVKWSSSNDKIASVDENGLVTAVKKGNAVITASTNSGNKKATCKITVAGPTEISIKKVKIVLDKKSYDWSQEGVTPVFTVTYKGKELPPEEYSVSYLNESNMKAGNAVAVFTGTGIDADKDLLYFSGIKQVKFKIIAHDLKEEDITIEPISDQLYMIGGVKAEPVVKYKGTILTKGTDYTLTWQNNKAATTDTTRTLPSVTVKGTGNFKGTKKAEFIISKQVISEKNGFVVTVKDKKWTAKKDSYKSVPVVTDAAGNKLKAGRDYDKLTIDSYSYQGKEAGNQPEKGSTIIVTIIGKGNYTGTISGQYVLTE